MDPEQFFTASGVIIVAGKGGVGKTAVTATMAVAASSVGLRTLVVEVEGKAGLAAMFDSEDLAYEQQELVPAGGGHGGVVARSLTPDDALIDYLREHGMHRLGNRLIASGALDIVATAVPGIRDILVLGKVKQLERAGGQDVILLDAPAAGHAVTFLRSATGLADAVKVGPVHAQARDVLDLLGDPARCRVVLVTLPEETPVNELVETAYALEDEVGVRLGPIVVNGLYDEIPGLEDALEACDAAGEGGATGPLRDSARFRLQRRRMQQRHVERLRRDLPLEQLQLPFLFAADVGPEGSVELASRLSDALRALPDRRIDR